MVPTIRQSLNHITNIPPLHQIKKQKRGKRKRKRKESLKHFDTQKEESTVHQRLLTNPKSEKQKTYIAVHMSHLHLPKKRCKIVKSLAHN